MVVAFGLLTIGAWLVYSGFKGLSLIDVLAGKEGESLSPTGATLDFSDVPAGTDFGGGTFSGDIPIADGAKAIVDAAAAIAIQGSPTIYVVSDFRPNSTTTSGRPSDHSSNDANRAARDICKKGVDCIAGPPSAELDAAVVAIGKALGRTYKKGQTIDADNIHMGGYQIQIIWRTPKYGGHMGHIHVGAHKE